jgi:hypothetical protein
MWPIGTNGGPTRYVRSPARTENIFTKPLCVGTAWKVRSRTPGTGSAVEQAPMKQVFLGRAWMERPPVLKDPGWDYRWWTLRGSVAMGYGSRKWRSLRVTKSLVRSGLSVGLVGLT